MNFFMRKRFIGPLVVFLVTLNLFLLGTLWVGHLRPPRPGRSLSPEGREAEIVRFFVEELDLTPEQETSLRALQKELFSRVDAIQREAHDLRGSIVDESFKDPPNAARVKTLADVIGTKEAQKERILFEHFQEIGKICGPEQRARFESLVREFARTTGPAGPPPPPPPGERGRPHPPREGHGPGGGNGPRAERPF